LRIAGDLEETTGPGDAGAKAASAVGRGVRRVLVCGGDGTVGEVAARIARTGCLLGILPVGRGNDFAAALGIPPEPAAALQCFMRGYPRKVDLGVVNGRRFCTVAAIGFDSEVARRTRSGVAARLGRLAYPAGVVATLASYRAARLTLRGSFGAREGKYLMAAVSNTGRYGGGIHIAPDSSPDDGLLDCCLVGDVGRLRLLRIFPTAYRGRHVRFPEVEILRAATLEVESDRPLPIFADGEPAGETPAGFAIERLALTVIVPEEAG
jgi:diacylglycerol kinase (ATP)